MAAWASQLIIRITLSLTIFVQYIPSRHRRYCERETSMIKDYSESTVFLPSGQAYPSKCHADASDL